MKASDDTGSPIVLEDDPLNFDGNPDWAPDGRPTCQSGTVDVVANTPKVIQLPCADTGPAYERTSLTVDIPGDGQPSRGTLGGLSQGSLGSLITPDAPASITYTPSTGFVGTDTFQVRVRDEVAFGTARATMTVRVALPGVTPPVTTPPKTTPPPGSKPPATTLTTNGLTVSPRTWRRGVGPKSASSTPVGTRIKFRSSGSGRVTLSFQRVLPGRRVAGRCLAPTPARKGGPRCNRFRGAGSLAYSAAAGPNNIRFRGRLSSTRLLGLGRFRVVLRAGETTGKGPAANVSPPFLVVAG